MKGVVQLVGAGPGDPELITVKALKAIQSADVIVYDRLSSPELLEHAPEQCQQIYVGKAKGCQQMPQEQICQLLVTLAQQPRRIVRLKGGDPFVFGRGGEEMLALREAGIEYQVIPGVTAASGCAAGAGIPLTHREMSRSVTLMTAHGSDGKLPEGWQGLIKPDHTLVVYMGLTKMGLLIEQIIQAGQTPELPVAVISKGSTPEQQVVIGSLTDIEKKVTEAQLPSPALIMIGHTVALADALAFEAEAESSFSAFCA